MEKGSLITCAECILFLCDRDEVYQQAIADLGQALERHYSVVGYRERDEDWSGAITIATVQVLNSAARHRGRMLPEWFQPKPGTRTKCADHNSRSKRMSDFTILYDAPQEAAWFRSLNSRLADANEVSITEARGWPSMQKVLLYDRPDIVLLDGKTPILVVEETVEVPSGHNVGQRFARIAAAAEAGVPSLYFGPYEARKHGGNTAGPRYMNVRLFHALDAMEQITGTAVTTINWPVDGNHEVRRDQTKDKDVREYIETFLALYAGQPDLRQLNSALLKSDIHGRMVAERATFARNSINNPGQYDSPPPSVKILTPTAFRRSHGRIDGEFQRVSELVVYEVGMNHIRSDPYTGMSMLYRYLYVLGRPSRALVLWFPNITEEMWRTAAASDNRKDVRLFQITADAILFSDRLVLRESLITPRPEPVDTGLPLF